MFGTKYTKKSLGISPMRLKYWLNDKAVPYGWSNTLTRSTRHIAYPSDGFLMINPDSLLATARLQQILKALAALRVHRANGNTVLAAEGLGTKPRTLRNFI